MTAAWLRVLAILAIFLGVFLCGRALLLALYPDNFADLGLLGIAAAFGRGVVFDLSITLVFIGLPLLLQPLRAGGYLTLNGPSACSIRCSAARPGRSIS